MSSHREAPEIAKDPVADSTDVYAFVSPDKPDTVTLIANFIPLQQPDGGPNFYEFGDDVLYEIQIANSGKGEADIRYQFQFTTKIRNPKTFLYNTGQITDIADQTWNRPQFYSVTRCEGSSRPGAGQEPALSAGQRGAAQHAELRQAGEAGACTPWATARSSPVSGPMRSTSTSAASSTSVRCVRSTRRT